MIPIRCLSCGKPVSAYFDEYNQRVAAGEKSKDVLDDMVKNGELTVEQGKVLNEELKHNLKQTVKNNVNVKVKVTTPEELSELLDKMTPEQLEALKAQIKEKESTVDSEAEEVDADDTAEEVEVVEE